MTKATAAFQTESEKEKTANHWRNLKPGSTILLRDSQSIELGIYNKLGTNGINYRVKEVDRFDHLNAEGRESGICQWIFARLVKEGIDDLFLMVKSVKGQESECRVYYRPQVTDDNGIKSDLVPSGDRNDLIEAGHSWLFAEEDLSQHTFVELTFTKEIKYSADGAPDGTVYQQKPVGEVFANCVQNPNISEVDLVVTIVEYLSGIESINPEALIVEIGAPENEFGGNVTLYLGTPINLDEIDVLSF
jgi:hypothetical protein